MKRFILLLILLGLFFSNVFAQKAVLNVGDIYLGQSFDEIKDKYGDKLSIAWRGRSDCKTCGECTWNLKYKDYDDFNIYVDMKSRKVVGISSRKKVASIQDGILYILDTYGTADKKICYAKDGNKEISCLQHGVKDAFYYWTDDLYGYGNPSYGSTPKNVYATATVGYYGVFFKAPVVEINIFNFYERYNAVCK